MAKLICSIHLSRGNGHRNECYGIGGIVFGYMYADSDF